MNGSLLTIATNLVLMGLGLYLAAQTVIRGLFLPSGTGVVIGLRDLFDGACREEMQCTQACTTQGLAVCVRLPDNRVIHAEIGPCSACMDGLKPGDVVSITHVGGRIIAQKASRWRLGHC